MMQRIGTILALPLFALIAAPAVADDGKVPAKPDAIKLEKVKAAEIDKILAAHRGKVIAIDIWADFCDPCKKAFPHLIKLHNEFAKDGLVCISLSVDLEDNYDGALEFLKKQKATIPNYILWDTEENKDILQKKFEHCAIPIFHVFDRDGRKIKTWDGRIKHDEIDKLIQDLLKQKK